MCRVGGRLPKKAGWLGQFADLRREGKNLMKKKGIEFLREGGGVYTLMHTKSK